MPIKNNSLKKLKELTNQYESNVRFYSRMFDEVFLTAEGSYIYGESGKKYLDFLTGAGALNYGHNNKNLQKAIIEYVVGNNVIHSLDMYTSAHVSFITKFHDIILTKRNLNYKIQFTGPTGANAVEAALKLARISTRRKEIIYFRDSYHGLSLGALSVSDLEKNRKNALVNFEHTIMVPYDDVSKTEELLIELKEHLLKYKNHDLPAAIILETVQGEGGINSASVKWLQGIREISQELGILLIVDEIQTGCGRTGTFFSFERANIVPDIVCLSKSLSGFGLPLSVILINPTIDVWYPGEHTGTFRGNNLALVSAEKSLDFWEDGHFQNEIQKKSLLMNQLLDQLIQRYPDFNATKKGIGLMCGIEWSDFSLAKKVSSLAFKNGLIIETVGKQGQVLKIMPALTIREEEIQLGVHIIEKSISQAV